MINLTFKNVGQGDSIIIEWTDNSGNPKIGFIDCALYQKKNLSLEHFVSNNYKEIEFIIFSHPHFDHFSGIKMILDFCDQNDIIIRHFYHTSQNHPKYLASALKTAMAEKALHSLFLKVKELFHVDGKRLIKHQIYVDDFTTDISLKDDIKLKFLTPTSHEYNSFTSKTYTKVIDVGKFSNPHGNWLSTFIKIYKKDTWYLLLTSDLEPSVLIRIGEEFDKKENEHFKGELLLAQAPHHGSDLNHSPTFWRNRKGKKIIISAGDQEKYFHPGDKVITFFKKNKYSIYSTNCCGALNHSINKTVSSKKTLLAIAGITSTKGQQNTLNGNQKFRIENDKIIYLGN